MCDNNCYLCDRGVCVKLGADNTVASDDTQAHDDAMDVLNALYNEAVMARDWVGAVEALELIEDATRDGNRLAVALLACCA